MAENLPGMSITSVQQQKRNIAPFYSLALKSLSLSSGTLHRPWQETWRLTLVFFYYLKLRWCRVSCNKANFHKQDSPSRNSTHSMFVPHTRSILYVWGIVLKGLCFFATITLASEVNLTFFLEFYVLVTVQWDNGIQYFFLEGFFLFGNAPFHKGQTSQIRFLWIARKCNLLIIARLENNGTATAAV